MRNILCYGDSNTWGYVAGSRNYESMYVERHDRGHRWTGLLQSHLGEGYYVIEEGLNGRTTNLDDPFPPDRNGKNYLPPCLCSHAPLDLVILTLGGNDLKSYFNRTPEHIRDGLAELVDIIQGTTYGADMQSPPPILIIPPPIPLPISETFTDSQGKKYLEGGIEKAKQLVPLYRELSKQKNAYFLDLSKAVIPSKVDGMHFDEEAHALMAIEVYTEICAIFSKKPSCS